MTRSGRPLIQKILAILGVLACLAALSLAIFAKRIERWARHELVDLYLDEIRPLLPFDIASVEYEGTWRDLIAGRVPRLTLNLKSRPAPAGEKNLAWSARLSGPLDVSRRAERVRILYEPGITLNLIASQIENQLKAKLEVELDRHPRRAQKAGSSELLAARLELSGDQLRWPAPQVEVKTLKLRAHWDQGHENGKAAAELSFGTATLSFPQLPSRGAPASGDPTRVIQLAGGELRASTPLMLSPTRIGPEVAVDLQGRSAEIAWDAEYVDAPWSALPLRAQIQLDDEHQPRSVLARLGAASELQARAKLTGALGAKGAQTKLTWKSAAIDLAGLVAALKKATGPTGAGEAIQHWTTRLQILAGTVATEGRATLRSGKGPEVSGRLRIRDAGVRWPEATFAAHGVNLELPFGLRAGQPELTGEVRADQLAFRRVRARLDPTSLLLRKGEIKVSGPRPASPLPLVIEGLATEIGALSGKLTPKLGVRTSFRLPEIPIERILDAVCIKKGRLPPATVSAALSGIDFSGDDLDLTGELTAKVFEGTFRIGEMGAFDLHSGVPEIDFDADLKGVRLDLLGEWLGFGAMRGTLEAYAHDVTMQSWLPTHYDFSLDAKPAPGGGWVDFSPEALKNLIELFAADSMDSIPGIAQWVAFGAPSHLLGGYDVKYAGLSLFSNDGVTLMESHDVPEVLHWKKKRYVIWGRRFAMPMPLGSHYPLVVDATAMGNLVHHMVQNFQELSRRKQERDAEKNAQAARALNQVFKKSILPLGAQTYDDELPEDCRPQ